MPAQGPRVTSGDLLPGTKYRIVRKLGVGGMGVVYQVVKPPAIQGVLKLMGSGLARQPEFRTRFFDEVRILAQLDHPNIVRVFDYDALDDGTPFYVMELLHGRTVRDVLQNLGALAPRVAYEVTTQLLAALHCAHTHDVTVVHRDIKPENIFLHTPRHGPPLVKLIDFGVIAVADREHDNTFVGTWKYAAPEQIRGDVATPATDLYAVGLVLYEMLAGVGPFDHVESGPLVSKAHLREIPAPVTKFAPWVPPAIVELVASALAKTPGDRPRDAIEFTERLAPLRDANVDGSTDAPARSAVSPLETITDARADDATPTPPVLGDSEPERRSRSRWAALLILILLLAASAAGVVLVVGGGDSPASSTDRDRPPTGAFESASAGVGLQAVSAVEDASPLASAPPPSTSAVAPRGHPSKRPLGRPGPSTSNQPRRSDYVRKF